MCGMNIFNNNNKKISRNFSIQIWIMNSNRIDKTILNYNKIFETSLFRMNCMNWMNVKKRKKIHFLDPIIIIIIQTCNTLALQLTDIHNNHEYNGQKKMDNIIRLRASLVIDCMCMYASTVRHSNPNIWTNERINRSIDLNFFLSFFFDFDFFFLMTMKVLKSDFMMMMMMMMVRMCWW